MKQLSLKERIYFTLNYVKNFLFIIVPLTTFLGYVAILIVKDTDAYKRVNAVVEWYEEKSNSFAVGLRVNKVKNEDGKTVYKVVYKATNGETYKAFYSEESGCYYYSDDNGNLKECH